MISYFHIDMFRDKLHSLCEEEKFTITFLPPIVEVFQNNKPFYGTIKNDSFKLRKNTRLLHTSYFIEGTFEKFNNITTVNYNLKHDTFSYYAVRWAWLVITAFGTTVLLANGVYNFKYILGILLFSLLTLIHVPIDNQRGKELEKLFIDKLDIAPN